MKPLFGTENCLLPTTPSSGERYPVPLRKLLSFRVLPFGQEHGTHSSDVLLDLNQMARIQFQSSAKVFEALY